MHAIYISKINISVFVYSQHLTTKPLKSTQIGWRLYGGERCGARVPARVRPLGMPNYMQQIVKKGRMRNLWRRHWFNYLGPVEIPMYYRRRGCKWIQLTKKNVFLFFKKTLFKLACSDRACPWRAPREHLRHGDGGSSVRVQVDTDVRGSVCPRPSKSSKRRRGRAA
jgi:hypothetical protein